MHRSRTVDQRSSGSEMLPRDFDIFCARVAHQGMDIDGAERDLAHEVQPHHHHPGNPEEMMSSW